MDFGSAPKANSIVGAVIHMQQVFFLVTSDVTHQLKLWLVTVSYINMLITCLENIHIAVAYSNFNLEIHLFQR